MRWTTKMLGDYVTSLLKAEQSEYEDRLRRFIYEMRRDDA